MDMANIYIKMEIYMKAILKMPKLMDMEYQFIIMDLIKEIDMKEIIKIGIRMEKAFFIIIMEIFLKGNLKMIKKMEKAFYIIKMVIGKSEIILKIIKLGSILSFWLMVKFRI